MQKKKNLSRPLFNAMPLLFSEECIFYVTDLRKAILFIDISVMKLKLIRHQKPRLYNYNSDMRNMTFTSVKSVDLSDL